MFEEIRDELIRIFDELEQDVARHELGEIIRNRQFWVLWEEGVEQDPAERIPIIDDLIDFFREIFGKY